MRTSSLVLGGGVLEQFAFTVRIRFIFQGIGDAIVLICLYVLLLQSSLLDILRKCDGGGGGVLPSNGLIWTC